MGVITDTMTKMANRRSDPRKKIRLEKKYYDRRKPGGPLMNLLTVQCPSALCRPETVFSSASSMLTAHFAFQDEEIQQEERTAADC